MNLKVLIEPDYTADIVARIDGLGVMPLQSIALAERCACCDVT